MDSRYSVHFGYSFYKLICVGFLFIRTHILAKYRCFSDASYTIIGYVWQTDGRLVMGKYWRYYTYNCRGGFVCFHFQS